MAKRLIKIAKELNVGTATLVSHLQEKGFDIENKPTSKVSDEMERVLLDAFQKSVAIKEKADQIMIGFNKTDKAEEEEQRALQLANEEKEKAAALKAVEVKQKEEAAAKAAAEKAAAEAKVAKEKADALAAEKAAAEKKAEEMKVVKEVVTEKPVETPVEKPTEKKVGIKVLGKIDLDQNKKPSSSKKPEAKPAAKVDAPKVEPKKEKVIIPFKKIGDKSESASKNDEVLKASAPTLKGLKVVGKINVESLKPKSSSSSSSDDKKKRKRTRKKVPARVPSTRRPGAAGNRTRRNDRTAAKPKKDEVKEISKKEIDDKIKATMARLQGGSGKKKRQKQRRDVREKKRERKEMVDMEKQDGKIHITEFITVSEIASIFNIDVSEVIMTCMNMGVIVSINQRLDAEIIEIIADEFEKDIEFISAEEMSETEEEIIDAPEDLVTRAPIVTVMGHVDHGKTSLLDHIRKSTVADGEAGGITQHIGAYEVDLDGRNITFLDTPGHEAFTAMRARGAKVTDIAIIIIAADDNIMPQTKEAISHAQAANVPMVFAINKIDKDGASPDRIKQELSGMNILVEEWGGKYQSQDISAKMGTNIDLLLEKVLLEADLLELKANPKREGTGSVIEASLDKGRGYVTKMLVQSGTLKIGDPIVAGSQSGKIKAMFNEYNKKVKEAGPSTPVLVLGLDGAPQAGEKFKVMESEQEARTIATRRQQIDREQSNRASKRISLDEIGRRLALGSFKELNLIVKGDVDGSVEALSDSLIKQSIESVQVNVIHKAVGQIIDSDVNLAAASDAIIIGFQVRPSGTAKKLAESEQVEIKHYSVIYEAIDDIRDALEGMLEPTKEEKVIGEVEIRETFKISKVGTIAGCYVREGRVTRNSMLRVIRDGLVIYPNKEGVIGELDSLKRFKDDVKEVKAGYECGLALKGYNDIEPGDYLEIYEIVEIKQTLDKKK